MAKAKFFLNENRNTQIDPSTALPTDIYLPANNGRDVIRRESTQGRFSTTVPSYSVSLNSYLTNWLAENFDAGDIVYPFTGNFEVASDTAVITSAVGVGVTATAGEIDLTSAGGPIDINSATAITLDSDGATTITAATNLTAEATAGKLNLVAGTLDVDIDANTDVTVNATTGDIILTSGDDIIFTPTANLTFTLAAIPTYADDTAAGVGGLTAGQVYKQATGELMIKL